MRGTGAGCDVRGTGAGCDVSGPGAGCDNINIVGQFDVVLIIVS